MPSKTVEINKLYNVIESLKLTGRANLEQRFKVKTVDVYVDLLDPYHKDWVNPSPKSLIYSLKNKRTTFILGRKGTGKSTLFQVLMDINEQEVEKNFKKDKEIGEIFIYLNAREAFDLSNLFTSEDIGYELRFLSFLNLFMETLVGNLKKYLLENNKWYRKIFGKDHKRFDDLKDEFDKIEKNLIYTYEKSYSQNKNIKEYHIEKSKTEKGAELSIKPHIGIKKEESTEVKTEYEKIVHDKIIRIINPSKVLQEIKGVLLKYLKIKSLTILLDDFSDLSQEFMEKLIEKVISPQVMASEPYYFFKIAAYPSRIRTGDIPEDKIEYIGIDIGEIFAWGRKAEKEVSFTSKINRGIHYTKLLIQRRCEMIADNGELFDSYLSSVPEKSKEEIYETLFYASFTNPRIIGYILSFSLKHALQVKKDLKIELGYINQASKDYYERMIDRNYFKKQGKVKQAYDDKLNLATQEIIFTKLIEIAQINQKELVKVALAGKNKLLKQIYEVYGLIFNSHFRLQKDNVAELLKSLELNQYITHFSEGRERDKAKKTNLYFFNYGLCLEKGLDFGIPTNSVRISRPDKFISQDRNFNYTTKLLEKLKKLMQIRCGTSDCSFKPIPIENVIVAEHLGWKCPTCNTSLERKPLPEITENILKEHSKTEDEIEKKFNYILNEIQYEIIQTLSTFGKEVKAKDISQEINLSSQSIGKRMTKLSDYGFIKITNRNPKRYSLTEKAKDYLSIR